MKAILSLMILFLVLMAVGMLPFRGKDAAQLSPIQTLLAEFSDAGVKLKGDDGQEGIGEDWNSAVENLKQTSTGIPFLDTAERIILSGDIKKAVSTLLNSDNLRPAAEIFSVHAADDVKALGEYLQTHSSDLTLSKLKAAILHGEIFEIPHINGLDGRWLLDE